MSRPEKPIDWDKVDELLMAGCDGTEIAPHFDMHPRTFYDRVEEKYGITLTAYSSEKRCQGNSSLKYKQFEKALNGSDTMLIWLGKQRLNQKENHDISPIDAQTFTQFNALMAQLKINQDSTSKIADSNINKDA
jgi:hypothetical protein